MTTSAEKPSSADALIAHAACGAKGYFPRDRVGHVAAAHVVCTKPAGHADPVADPAHEARRGSTAYCWRLCRLCGERPPALGSDICEVCHDAD